MNLDQLLQGLRADYIAQLPKKILVIEAQIQAANVDDLRESFHKLKGTGKTYGLPEVSELAEVIEDHCLLLPQTAVGAARTGLELLKEVCAARQNGRELSLSTDSRLLALRKLLPN